jgi:hypothetical protein
MLKILAVYPDKQKSFIPKKKLKCTVIALISAKRWRLDVLTFLIHGFEKSEAIFSALKLSNIFSLGGLDFSLKRLYFLKPLKAQMRILKEYRISLNNVRGH